MNIKSDNQAFIELIYIGFLINSGKVTPVILTSDLCALLLY